MANTIKQLITHDDNVSISSTKFWYNMVCIISTGIVIWYSYNLKLDWLMLLIYMSCVGSMKVASDIIRMRSGINTPEPIKEISEDDKPAITNPQLLNE